MIKIWGLFYIESKSDIVVTYITEKEVQKTTKEYEYLLKEKQSQFEHFNEENNARGTFLYALKVRETKGQYPKKFKSFLNFT